VTIRSEIQTENIFSLGFQNIRQGVTTVRRLILWSLGCTCFPSSLHSAVGVQKGLSGVITLVLHVLHPYECNLVAGGQRLERQRALRGHASSLVWTVKDLQSMESKLKVRIGHIPRTYTWHDLCGVSALHRRIPIL
jgi:hypothetical protein